MLLASLGTTRALLSPQPIAQSEVCKREEDAGVDRDALVGLFQWRLAPAVHKSPWGTTAWIPPATLGEGVRR